MRYDGSSDECDEYETTAKEYLEAWRLEQGQAQAYRDEIKALREANQKAKDRCQELIRESDRRLDGVLYIQEALLEKGNE
jgi:hypothetical protein